MGTPNYINILSFDCAIRTLGYVYARVDLNYLSNIYYDINYIGNKHVDIIYCGVKDLLDDPKITIKSVPYIQRFDKLYQFLNSLKISENTIVLLEDQWNINSQSNAIASGIVMYYLSRQIPHSHIVSIAPTKKNKIALRDDLTFEKIKLLFPNNTKYTRSKRVKYHTIENTKYFAKLYNYTHLFKDIKADKLEHVSDAFMQLYYYVFHTALN
jgi:hypothetical protein